MPQIVDCQHLVRKSNAMCCSQHPTAAYVLCTSLHCMAAVTLSWASDVTPEEGFTFAAIHPGVVATDMNTASMQ